MSTAQGGETGRLQARVEATTAQDDLLGYHSEDSDPWNHRQARHVHNWYEEQPPAGISFDSEMLGMFHAQRLHNEEAPLPESASPSGNVPRDVTAGVTLDAELLGMCMYAQRLHDEMDTVPPALVVESDSDSESDEEPYF